MEAPEAVQCTELVGLRLAHSRRTTQEGTRNSMRAHGTPGSPRPGDTSTLPLPRSPSLSPPPPPLLPRAPPYAGLASLAKSSSAVRVLSAELLRQTVMLHRKLLQVVVPWEHSESRGKHVGKHPMRIAVGWRELQREAELRRHCGEAAEVLTAHHRVEAECLAVKRLATDARQTLRQHPRTHAAHRASARECAPLRIHRPPLLLTISATRTGRPRKASKPTQQAVGALG